MTLYSMLKNIVKFYLQIFFTYHVTGKENIPQEGPVMLISNHISNYDPLVVACAIHREVHFMAKEELFQIKALRIILEKVGAFPIKRGGNDRKAIKQALQVLKEGHVLGIFPEGTRSKTGDVGKGLPGAALFALKSDAIVIPIGIYSTYKWFQPIKVNIGKPISLEKFKEEKVNSEGLEDVISYLMKHIHKQVEEAKG